MLKILKTILILFFIGLVPLESHAEWSFEAFSGAAYSFPTPLRFHQNGEDDIHLNAKYKGEPFNASHAAPYV